MTTTDNPRTPAQPTLAAAYRLGFGLVLCTLAHDAELLHALSRVLDDPALFYSHDHPCLRLSLAALIALPRGDA